MEANHPFSSRIDAVFRIEGLNFIPKDLTEDLGIEPSETSPFGPKGLGIKNMSHFLDKFEGF